MYKAMWVQAGTGARRWMPSKCGSGSMNDASFVDIEGAGLQHHKV